MTKEFEIKGMTCNGCVANVTKQLDQNPLIDGVDINLEYPQAKISTRNPISVEKLQQMIAKAGHYTIHEIDQPKEITEELPPKSITTYKPLILIVGFILMVTILAQYPFISFSWIQWMRHFMAGFFIVFSFFKLLNLKGFASSYSMYDLIAAKWKTWGYLYPFIELVLGLLYLMNVAPITTNVATALVLGVSSIGVIKSNLDKKKIKCACLGDVFNLPMSTVTIVEDVSMVGMAVVMLFVHHFS